MLMQEEPTPAVTNQFTALPTTDDSFYQADQPFSSEPETISWTASEYIAHDKSVRWFAMLGLAAGGGALVVWLLTKDLISAFVVLIGAGVLGGYGVRQPRELQYQLDINTLTIGNKRYDLDAFRSFTVDDQQAFSSVNLMPLKRFSLGLSIYFAPTDEAAIVDLLALRLPIEEHQPDVIDRLMRHIRF